MMRSASLALQSATCPVRPPRSMGAGRSGRTPRLAESFMPRDKVGSPQVTRRRSKPAVAGAGQDDADVAPAGLPDRTESLQLAQLIHSRLHEFGEFAQELPALRLVPNGRNSTDKASRTRRLERLVEYLCLSRSLTRIATAARL